MSQNTDPPLTSPLYGTATFSTLSPSGIPESPSRLSYTDSSHTYAEDNSFDDSAEVEAALNAVDDQLDNAEDALTEWSSTRTGTLGTITTTQPFSIDRERRILSTITERTEDVASRPTSNMYNNFLTSAFGSRPVTLFSTAAASSAELIRRSLYDRPASTSPTQARSSTDSGSRSATPEQRIARPTPGRRAGNLIAFFEEKSTTETLSPTITSTYGYTRTTSAPLGPRSPSPFALSGGSYTTTMPFSNSMPTVSRTGQDTFTRTGDTFTRTGSTLPTFESTYSAVSRPTSPSKTSRSGLTSTIPASTVESIARSPHSPLHSVRGLVAAWKERTPSLGKTSTRSAVSTQSTSTPTAAGEGFFSLKRRADRGNRRLREAALGGAGASADPPQYDDFGVGEPGGNTERRPENRRSGAAPSLRSITGSLPMPFDIAELGPYARGSQEPLRVGLLWYLNVHAPAPYRWQRCQAVLYPSMLLLSWIAPGGGRGVVTLDLLNCNEVRSVPSPAHPSAREDIGTIAAQLQVEQARGESASSLERNEMDLVEMLCPFQLLYGDGIERLGAESARERVRWVSAIWEALDRSVSLPDRSQTRSPTGSIRTIGSISSVSSTHSGSGSRSTIFVPPLESLDTIPDFRSTSSRSSLSATSLTRTFAGVRGRATDDGAISSRGYLQPLLLESSTREIAPSRSSSLRRTSSLTDLDAEFASALSGLGIGTDRSSITRSSNYLTASSGGSRLSQTLSTDDAFFSASSTSGVTRRVPASTFYALGSSGSGSNLSSYTTASTTASLSATTRDPTTTTSALTPGTHGLTSTLSPRRTESNTLGDIRSTTPGSSTTGYGSSYTYGSGSYGTGSYGTGSHGSGSYGSGTYGTGSGIPTTPTRSLSPTYSATGSSRSPETYSTTSSSLVRAREVRRRAPRRSRGTSTSYTGVTPSESDKENDDSTSYGTGSTPSRRVSSSGTPSMREKSTDTADVTPLTSSGTPWDACNTDEWTSLNTRSFTTTSYSYSDVTTSSQQTPKAISEAASDSDVYLTASQRTSFFTARSPTPTPSHSSYATAPPPSDVSSDFETAPKAPSTEYETAKSVSTEPETEYITAEVYSSESEAPTTEYNTAECRCIPSEIDEEEVPENISTLTKTPSISDLGTPKVQESDEVSLYTPSMVGTIPDEVIEAANIPLPESAEPSEMSTPSEPSSEPTETSLTEIEEVSLPVEVVSTSTPTPSPLSSLWISPPQPEDIPLPPTPSLLSSISSTSVSTVSTWSTSRPPSSVTESSLPPPPSPWAPDTDMSYESSILRATPSVHSVALPDGVDISFETSFLRPSTTDTVERELMTTITDESESESESTETPLSTSTAPTSSMLSMSSIPVSVHGMTVVTVSRSPSSVSTTSTMSMSSSMFDASSLLDVPLSPSTEPSLLSTQRSFTPSSPSYSTISPARIPLPSSPALSTPSASISVSVSTPRSALPSIHSLSSVALPIPPPVVTPRSPPPPREPSLAHDIDRVLQYLNDLDRVRGGEADNIKDHLGRIEDELRDLGDFIRSREHPPPVPLKDRSAGGSSPIPTTPQPTDPREQYARGGLSVRSLTPPRMAPSPTIPSSLSSSMSFLSSHHSDDFSLMSLEEYPRMGSEPSDSSPDSSSDESSEYSSSTSDASLSVRTMSIVDSNPTPPPGSVTPLTRSVSPASTIRPASPVRVRSPTESLGNLRNMLEGLRDSVDAVWQGQRSTNHMLDELRARQPPAVPDNAEVNDRLRRIEDLLDNILNHALPRPAPQPSEASDESSDTSSAVQRLLERLRERRPEAEHIVSPTPMRPARSFDAEWAEFLGAPPATVEPTIHGPPALVQLVRRAPRVRREGSISPPISEPASFMRAGSAPLPSRIRVDPFRPMLPPHRADYGLQGPRHFDGAYTEPSEPDAQYMANLGRQGRPGPSRRPPARRPEDDIDFLERLRRRRQADHPGTDGWINNAQPTAVEPQVTANVPPPRSPTRVQTAPPAPISDTWYLRPAPQVQAQDVHPPMVPPPGFFPSPQPAGIAAPPPGMTFGPAPGGPPMMAMPMPIPTPSTFNEMLDLLRQNRLAQTASIDQQREIMRYMRGLNEWLALDVRDRQDEIRSIGARVDALRDDLGRMGLMRPGQPVVPPVPLGQVGGPTYVIPPLPLGGGYRVPGGAPGPVVPPAGTPGFPPGFMATGYDPVVPNVMPGARPTSPFIPPPPTPHVHGGGPHVIHHYPSGPPSPRRYHEPSPESSEGLVIPSPPPLQGYPIPPPPEMYSQPPQQPPMIIRTTRSSRSRSGSRSSDRRSRSSSRSSPRTTHIVHHHEHADGPPTVVRVEGSQPTHYPGTAPSFAPLAGAPRHPDAPGAQSPPLIVTGGPGQYPQQPQQPTIIIQQQPTGGLDPPIVRVQTRTSGRRSPQPLIVQEGSRSESPSSAQPVIIHRAHSRARSHSRTPPAVIIQGESGQSSSSRSHHHQPIVYQGGSTRRRRSRTPPPVVIQGSSRRSHSPSMTRVIRTDSRRDRSRSHSPSHVVVRGSSRRGRSRSPHRVIITGDTSRRDRSRSRSPIILGDSGRSRRGRSSPTVVLQSSGRRSRSRSRSPRVLTRRSPSRSSSAGPTVIIEGPRRHSQSPTRIIRTGSRRHSRSPTRIIRTGSRRHSRSPTRIIRTGSQRSGRSRSPIVNEGDEGDRQPPVIVVPSSRRGSGRHRTRFESPRRSRSHSPYYDDHDGGRRSRSHSPRPLGHSHSHRSHQSHRRSPHRTQSQRSRSRSPTNIALPHSRRSRSPTYRSDYSRSPSRRSSGRVPHVSRRRTRTGSRSPTSGRDGRYRSHGRRGSRSPSVEGDRRHRRYDSYSPTGRRRSADERHQGDRRRPHDHSPTRRHRTPNIEGDQPYRSGSPSILHSRRPRTPVMSQSSDAGSPSRPIIVRTTPTRRRDTQSPTFVPIHSPEPSRVIRTPTSRVPDEEHDGGPGAHVPRTRVPTIVTLQGPETLPTRTPPPDVSRYSPPISEGDAGRPPVVRTHRTASPTRLAPLGRPLTPRSDLASQLRDARDGEPIIPVVPSEGRRPLPGRPSIYAAPPSEISPQHLPSPASPGSILTAVPRMPSGPGDLESEQAEHLRQQRFDEHEQRLLEVRHHAEEAEEMREQFFREHEDERDRIFQDNEERRDQEAMERRDEIFRTLEERLALPGAPVEVIPSQPIVEGELPGMEAGTESAGSIRSGRSGRTIGSGRSSRPRPGVCEIPQEQLAEIQDLVMSLRDEMQQERAAAQTERLRLAEEADAERARADEENSARVQALEEELARLRAELDEERGQRRNEELERIERERSEFVERDEAVRGQLGDITNIVQEQRDECARKKQLMDERWEEKENRRREKDNKSDMLFNMVEQLIQAREDDRLERERERAAEAEKPGIERVLEELQRQSEIQNELIHKLAEEWREDIARQHAETIEQVKATAQEMVPYNVTGYLDEFSKALAGEIRILLGEVGRLHEQKRTLQFELGNLLTMKSKYGPGGEFDEGWRPTTGPLAPGPPPDLAPPPGPGPEEPPPPARPAWRNVQQRPSRKKKGPKEQEPPVVTLVEPPEPPRAPSWSTWQPHPTFAPTPPPAEASPLLVPPQGPPGLFGPRSPRGTMYQQ